jgi:carboxypeptidase Q
MRLSLHAGILATLALLAEAVPTPKPRALPLVQSVRCQAADCGTTG